MSSRKYTYSDDIFKSTRMSFGDHLEELSRRMWAALKALLACVCLSFALDGFGALMQWETFGIGKPVMDLIELPAKRQLDHYFDERSWKAKEAEMAPPQTREERERRDEEKKKYLQECLAQRAMSTSDLNKPQPLRVQVDRQELKQAAEQGDGQHGELTILVNPVDLAQTLRLAQERIGKRNQLGALSFQETFLTYFKVTLLCGFIMASPLIFYQFWAFVGAGLYPHEKRYIHIYLPFSIGLFLGGVVLCFVWVMPGALKYLLSFNEWFGVDPDIRLNEWLSLALILPLVFGLSFQTPLVMLFFNRLGMFTWQAYLSKWRYAVISLAMFAAVVNPTTDVVTMMYLFIPMLGLYLLGILLCRMATPPEREEEEAKADEEVAV